MSPNEPIKLELMELVDAIERRGPV